jgi:hypothetical protein
VLGAGIAAAQWHDSSTAERGQSDMREYASYSLGDTHCAAMSLWFVAEYWALGIAAAQRTW